MSVGSMRLSDLEAQCLRAWQGMNPDFGYLSFSVIEGRSSLPSHQIRRVTRALARKGLVAYARGLFTDMGEPAGAGYGLTASGQQHLSKLEKANG